MRRTLGVLTIAMVVISAGAIVGSAASPKTPPSKQEIAKRILATPAGKTLTPTARIALEAIARGDHRATPDSNGISAPATTRQPKGTKPVGGPLPNVRVNDPSKDSNQADQTTQSETSVAVSGSNVAVGYNDSQRTLLFLTAASNLSGVSSSTDGGQTFTDGGTIPNAPAKNNLVIRGWQQTAAGRCTTRTWSSTSAPSHCWWAWQSRPMGARPGARRTRSRHLRATSSGTARTKTPWSPPGRATCTTLGTTSPPPSIRTPASSPCTAACPSHTPPMAAAAG